MPFFLIVLLIWSISKKKSLGVQLSQNWILSRNEFSARLQCEREALVENDSSMLKSIGAHK